MRSSKYSVLEDRLASDLRPRNIFKTSLQQVILFVLIVAALVSLTLLTRVSRSAEESREDGRTLPNGWEAMTEWPSTASIVELTTPPDEEVSPSENATGDTLRFVIQPGYVIENPGLCPDGGESLSLLVLVTSAPDHLRHRMAIRYTWGHFAARSDVSIGFVLGLPDDDKVQERLREEFDIYNDLIQSRNDDRYDLLTVKTATLLNWVDDHCAGAKFVLKTDDDMFINIPELMKFQKQHDGAKNTIFGNVATGWRPMRSPSSKYRVTYEQFNGTFFPNFATGPAYLMTRDVVRPMYLEALNRRLFPLEDVFFTGIIASYLGINKVHDSKFHDYREKDTCKRQTSISLHDLNFQKQFALWSQTLDGKNKC